jgi:nitroreductase
MVLLTLTLDESTTESKIIGMIAATMLVVCLSSTYCVGRATSLARPVSYFIGAVLAGGVVTSFLVGASKPSNWWRLYADAAPFGLVLAAMLALTLSFTGTWWGKGRAAEGTDSSSMPDADATLELIKRRRSVFPKDFSGQRVPRAVLQQCLEAANWAPTHGKTEPWRFIVFEGDGLASLEGAKREAVTRLMAGQPEAQRATLDKFERKARELAKVSAVVALVVKRVANAKGNLMPAWEETAAVSCAVHNFHLALVAAGYVRRPAGRTRALSPRTPSALG